MTEEHPAAPVEPKMVHTDPWREGAGLIDRLLDMRSLPPVAGQTTENPYTTASLRYLASEDFADGYKAGLDAALDALVPTLKEIVLQPPAGGMAGAYSKSLTDKLIGRVPLRRTRFGWE